MASTSINIQPCKIGSSEQHNYRTKELDYVRPELSRNNESWQSDDKTLSQHLDAVRTLVKEKTGRKLQDKATPIREGVIVIKEDTSLEDLKRFGDACRDRWGIKPLQIHTHKDEGYMHAKQWTPNLHAHIVFLWVDETTGKSIKMNSQQMAEMQTLLAETLGMDRGASSDKKHLSSLQFKNEAEGKRLVETQNQLQEATKDLGEVENIREKIREATEAQIKPIETIIQDHTTKGWLGGSKTDYEAVIGQVKAQEEAKAIVKVSEQTAKEQSLQAQIASLQADLRQERSRHRDTADRLDQAKETIKAKDIDLFRLAQFLRGYLKDGFEEFKEECQAYFQRKFGQVLDLASMALMWAGGVIRDNQENRYTADYDNAKLLINGKTIGQHEALEVHRYKDIDRKAVKGGNRDKVTSRIKR